MEADQMEVPCVVDGKYKLFPIKISSSESIGILKDESKETAADMFAHISARNLKLYHVEIPVHDDLKKSVKDKLSENPTELQAWPKLAAIFKDCLKVEVVHIIVKAPDSGTN
jgi:Crinkler effector protein N-terminal domain